MAHISAENNKKTRGVLMKTKIYRVYENDEVVAVFNKRKYADDFVEYQATISATVFEIEAVDLADWLIQPRDF